MTDDCVFCKIVNGEAEAEIVDWAPRSVAIVPLDPVTDGHMIVLPRRHVADATTDPSVTADVMNHAAWLAKDDVGPCNIITSVGEEATQTVMHLHIHVVPRRAGDGLALPWTGQHA